MSDTTKHTQRLFTALYEAAIQHSGHHGEAEAQFQELREKFDSHQALVDALEALMECAGGQYGPGYDEAFDKATAALERAKDKAQNPVL